MLHVLTGSRLHFGLMELAENQPNRYGGLGMMIDLPSLQLRLSDQRSGHQPTQPANHSEVQRRIEMTTRHTLEALGAAGVHDSWKPHIELIDCPPMHSGLGVGTQLASAVATLVERAYLLKWTDVPLPRFGSSSAERIEQAVARLAHLAGRGKRSAIGLHGFHFGGLVKDLGYNSFSCSDSSPVPGVRPVHTQSTAMPSQWRVVLLTSVCTGDMCGVHEDRLIDRAGIAPNPYRQQMLELAEACTHAASTQQFEDFTQALDRYMELAARLFVPVQAGRYRDEVTTQRVEKMRQAGLAAVGQSSWGPTVFGFAPTDLIATSAAEKLNQQFNDETVRVLVTAPLNQGVRWLWRAQEELEYAR